MPDTSVKVTTCVVKQFFDSRGRCIRQIIQIGDHGLVEWEDQHGNPIDCPDDSWYHPFDMAPTGYVPVVREDANGGQGCGDDSDTRD